MKKKVLLVLLSLLMLSACTLKADNGVVSFSEPEELIEIEIDTKNQPLPDSKDDGELPVEVLITTGKEKFKSFATIRVQGSSTAKWPKKNWRFNFFSDSNRTEKIKMQIGDSVVSDKWIAKAEWIDPSMLRNATSFKLWESMVHSRDGEIKFEVDHGLSDNEKTGAQGFPKTYPARVKVDGKHYGTAILLLGHEPANFNIDKGNPQHVYMEFDARGGYTLDKTWEKFTSEGIGEWIDGYTPKNDKFTEEQKQAIDQLGSLINGDLDNFKANFHKQLDKQNMIDMLLFLEMIYDWDAVAQDIEMVTYDLEKWFMLPWDKDTTFGMNWDESGIFEGSHEKLLFDYDTEKTSQKPWFKTYHAFTEEVEARYAQLRNEDVFSVNNIKKITNSILDMYSDKIWEEEIERWKPKGRPSLEEATQEQLLEWFEARLEVLDQHFNYN